MEDSTEISLRIHAKIHRKKKQKKIYKFRIGKFEEGQKGSEVEPTAREEEPPTPDRPQDSWKLRPFLSSLLELDEWRMDHETSYIMSTCFFVGLDSPPLPRPLDSGEEREKKKKIKSCVPCDPFTKWRLTCKKNHLSISTWIIDRNDNVVRMLFFF